MAEALTDTARELLFRARRLLGRPEGETALRRHLDAAEAETRSAEMPRHCRECGSTDFEPIAARGGPLQNGITGWRCRSCGHFEAG
jgi:rubredoxin